MTPRSARRRVAGFTLIEILVALIVLAFGLLALARSLARSSEAEMEAVQREQAMALAQEIVDRINLNRKNAALYVGDYVPDGPVEDCAAPAGGVPPDQVQRDQCEWRNLLRGALVIDGDRPIGAPLAARGCIVATAPDIYVIGVAWQGVVPTAAPDNACGQGAFDREENRRVFSTVLQIARLGA